MADKRPGWQPTWQLPPGTILAETLDERGMSQAELARRMARPLKTINEIVKGKAAITPDTAIQLERVLGISAAFWNGLESQYRAALATDRADADLERHSDWVRDFPLAALKQAGEVRGRTTAELTRSLLAFFEVSSPEGWQQQWQATAARFRRPRHLRTSLPALSAWLRLGELGATEIETRPFNAERLRSAVPQIPALSQQPVFSLAVTRLRALCASAGVAVVVTPEVSDVHVSGASRWLTGDRPLIQVSLRYRSDDQFWFTVLHEIAHVLSETRASGFIDEGERADHSPAESEANVFASKVLIDPAVLEQFITRGAFSASEVENLASRVGVSPGVVVGQLQRRELIPFNSGLNRLKRRYE